MCFGFAQLIKSLNRDNTIMIEQLLKPQDCQEQKTKYLWNPDFSWMDAVFSGWPTLRSCDASILQEQLEAAVLFKETSRLALPCVWRREQHPFMDWHAFTIQHDLLELSSCIVVLVWKRMFGRFIALGPIGVESLQRKLSTWALLPTLPKDCRTKSSSFSSDVWKSLSNS